MGDLVLDFCTMAAIAALYTEVFQFSETNSVGVGTEAV